MSEGVFALVHLLKYAPKILKLGKNEKEEAH